MTGRHDSLHGNSSRLVVKDGPADGRNIRWRWHLETFLLLIAPIGIWHVKIRPALVLMLFLIAIANQDYRQVDRRILIYTTVYVALMIALSALSGSAAIAVKGALSFASGFLMLIPGITIGRHLRFDGIRLQTLIPTSILLAVYFMSPSSYEGRLFFGLRGNPNGTGYSLLFTLLVLGIALASEFMARGKAVEGKLTKPLLVVNVVAVIVLLLFTNHRAGWLAAICFAIILLGSRFGSSRAVQLIAYLAAAGLFAGIIIAFDRKDMLATVESLSIRLSMWSSAITTTLETHPVLGHGFNTLRDVFGVYSYKETARIYNHPHNIIIEMFFSTGIVGLGLTLAYILSQIRIANLMRIDRYNPIAVASFGSMVALLVAFSFGRSIASFEVTGSLSCLYGILLGQSILYPENRGVLPR